MQTIKIANDKAAEFLKTLESQCVAWDKQSIGPMGDVVCKVDGSTFRMKLEPLDASTVVYLYGQVNSAGLVTWQVSGSPAIPIVFLCMNAMVWFMLFAAISRTLTGIALAFCGGTVLSLATLALYLYMEKRNARIAAKMDDRIIETAKLFEPHDAPSSGGVRPR